MVAEDLAGVAGMAVAEKVYLVGMVVAEEIVGV